MKRLALIVLMLFISSNTFAYDITITIPNEKVAEYRTLFLQVHPNDEKIPNPAYENPIDTPEIVPYINKYTDSEWIVEWLKRKIRDAIKEAVKRNNIKTDVINEGDDITAN